MLLYLSIPFQLRREKKKGGGGGINKFTTSAPKGHMWTYIDSKIIPNDIFKKSKVHIIGNVDLQYTSPALENIDKNAKFTFNGDIIMNKDEGEDRSGIIIVHSINKENNVSIEFSINTMGRNKVIWLVCRLKDKCVNDIFPVYESKLNSFRS